jgi:hypothetical protein
MDEYPCAARYKTASFSMSVFIPFKFKTGAVSRRSCYQLISVLKSAIHTMLTSTVRISCPVEWHAGRFFHLHTAAQSYTGLGGCRRKCSSSVLPQADSPAAIS